MQQSTGWRLIILAATFVVLGGLKVGEAVLVPVTWSVLLAAVLAPSVQWLVRRGAPQSLAVLIVSGGAVVAAMFGLSLLGGALQSFLVDLPQYREALDARWSDAVARLAARGIDAESALAGAQVEPGAVLASVGGLLSSLASAASDLLMVVLLSGFLLLEADILVPKVRSAFEDDETARALLGTGASLQTYIGLKTLTSVVTGSVVWLGLVLLGLGHAPLWGFVAFLLNFIPTIGSIVAAVPPLLLAIVTGGLVDAGLVVALYLSVNTVVGNVVEPRLMGDQLGLSPFVVLLALFAWGWLWGVNGMLLSVPLTVLLREMFATWPDTRWIATLMGPGRAVRTAVHDAVEPED